MQSNIVLFNNYKHLLSNFKINNFSIYYTKKQKYIKLKKKNIGKLFNYHNKLYNHYSKFNYTRVEKRYSAIVSAIRKSYYKIIQSSTIMHNNLYNNYKKKKYNIYKNRKKVKNKKNNKYITIEGQQIGDLKKYHILTKKKYKNKKRMVIFKYYRSKKVINQLKDKKNINTLRYKKYIKNIKSKYITLFSNMNNLISYNNTKSSYKKKNYNIIKKNIKEINKINNMKFSLYKTEQHTSKINKLLKYISSNFYSTQLYLLEIFLINAYKYITNISEYYIIYLLKIFKNIMQIKNNMHYINAYMKTKILFFKKKKEDSYIKKNKFIQTFKKINRLRKRKKQKPMYYKIPYILEPTISIYNNIFINKKNNKIKLSSSKYKIQLRFNKILYKFNTVLKKKLYSKKVCKKNKYNLNYYFKTRYNNTKYNIKKNKYNLNINKKKYNNKKDKYKKIKNKFSRYKKQQRIKYRYRYYQTPKEIFRNKNKRFIHHINYMNKHKLNKNTIKKNIIKKGIIKKGIIKKGIIKKYSKLGKKLFLQILYIIKKKKKYNNNVNIKKRKKINQYINMYKNIINKKNKFYYNKKIKKIYTNNKLLEFKDKIINSNNVLSNIINLIDNLDNININQINNYTKTIYNKWMISLNYLLFKFRYRKTHNVSNTTDNYINTIDLNISTNSLKTIINIKKKIISFFLQNKKKLNYYEYKKDTNLVNNIKVLNNYYYEDNINEQFKYINKFIIDSIINSTTSKLKSKIKKKYVVSNNSPIFNLRTINLNIKKKYIYRGYTYKNYNRNANKKYIVSNIKNNKKLQKNVTPIGYYVSIYNKYNNYNYTNNILSIVLSESNRNIRYTIFNKNKILHSKSIGSIRTDRIDRRKWRKKLGEYLAYWSRKIIRNHKYDNINIYTKTRRKFTRLVFKKLKYYLRGRKYKMRRFTKDKEIKPKKLLYQYTKEKIVILVKKYEKKISKYVKHGMKKFINYHLFRKSEFGLIMLILLAHNKFKKSKKNQISLL